MADNDRKSLWHTRDGRITLLLVGGIGLLTLALVATAFILGGRERERALADAELKLALRGDEAAHAVSTWLGEQDALIARTAANPTLQLLAGLGAGDPAAEAAGDYARALLIVTAEQGGLVRREPVSANLASDAGGIALLGGDGPPRLAVGRWPAALGSLPAGIPATAVRELHPTADGLWLVWRHPVLAAQREEGGAAGVLVAWMRIDSVLPALLSRTGRLGGMPTDALLVAATGAGLRALTPIPGLATATPWTLAVLPGWVREALAAPGRMRVGEGGQRRLLVFAQPVAGVEGWTVITTADGERVLAAARAATWRFAGFAVLVVGLIALLLLLFWRHAANRRLAATEAEQKTLIARLLRQSRFLEAATDAQPTEILVLDRQGIIRFANRRVREEVGADSDAILNKPVEAVLGADAGRALRLVAEAAFEEGPLQDTQEVETAEGGRRLYVINAVPLRAGEASEDEAVLLVREEVTSFVEERERRERTLKRLVATLAALIDARDPYAARQSERVVEVASALATSLNLTLYETEAVEVAGRLMNIGKMLVPREILVKKGRLSDAELRLVRDAMKKSADLLAGVEFDGPVVETLRQLHARVDGTGDPPLKGEEILITARVLAVANAFVAMVSPRAHRPGLSIDEALAELQKEAGTRFDRGVVAALAHQIENLDGRRRWARFAEMPEGIVEPGD